MKRDYITFRSITPAQQAQRLLQQAGVDALLQRTPRALAQNGCGYCLRPFEHQIVTAVELLRQASIPFRGIYREEGGRWEVLER
jgi:hypothetical protein